MNMVALKNVRCMKRVDFFCSCVCYVFVTLSNAANACVHLFVVMKECDGY